MHVQILFNGKFDSLSVCYQQNATHNCVLLRSAASWALNSTLHAAPAASPTNVVCDFGLSACVVQTFKTDTKHTLTGLVC